MVVPMMQFVGQITVTLAASHRGAAEARLRFLAGQLGDCFADVLFADHRGEVDDYQPVIPKSPNLTLVSGRPACFDDYAIHGVAQAADEQGRYLETVDDSEAEFWCLYGHLPGQGLKSIGEFSTREQAETVYACITGRTDGRPGIRTAKLTTAA
jgi:hypothetical protein